MTSSAGGPEDGSGRDAKPLGVVDLERRAAAMLPELLPALERVVRSGRYLLGPELEAFEASLATFAGRRFAVGVASGTDALALSLRALGVGPGDEVIVPAITAVPTVAAVCATGAAPVPVDVDPATGTLDPDAAAAAVTPRTRAVVPVHLYGRPADIPDVGVPVVEDAAHALSALDATSPSAAIACSFYPTKNLGALGDGGAVLTDDAEVAARVRRERSHGLDRSGRAVAIAGHSRLAELQAAALAIGLTGLRTGDARRRAIADHYRRAAPGLRWQAPHERHAYHLCVVRVPDRDGFRARMPFQTGVHYPYAVTQQPAYRRFSRHPCPEAERWAAECVSLPCFPEMTDEEVEWVCAALG